METLYTIDLIRHLPLSGHSDFILKLHGISSALVVGCISLMLWLLMMHSMHASYSEQRLSKDL